MACKTCDHTMQRINDGTPRVFWCPRCGTIKSEGCVPEYEAPKLVERASKLYLEIDQGEDTEEIFVPLIAAVRESVNFFH